MPKTNPPNRRLGYARVSIVGQTLDSQLEQLRADGRKPIFREKVTGARADRRELLKMLKALAPGHVVTMTRIDRLALSTFDLSAIVKRIMDAKAQFRSLAEPWADTGTSTGAVDDRRSRRGDGGGTRPAPRPHGGGARAGRGAGPAHGPTAEAHPAAAEGSTAAANRRGHAQGTGETPQRRQRGEFEAHGRVLNADAL